MSSTAEPELGATNAYRPWLAGIASNPTVFAACLVLAVLWMSRGALALVASMPLVSQALQLLGLVYVVELVTQAMRRRGKMSKETMEAWLLQRWQGSPG
jgi:threonine/homoserine/homoserine lactone efflux protein